MNAVVCFCPLPWPRIRSTKERCLRLFACGFAKSVCKASRSDSSTHRVSIFCPGFAGIKDWDQELIYNLSAIAWCHSAKPDTSEWATGLTSVPIQAVLDPADTIYAANYLLGYFRSAADAPHLMRLQKEEDLKQKGLWDEYLPTVPPRCRDCWPWVWNQRVCRRSSSRDQEEATALPEPAGSDLYPHQRWWMAVQWLRSDPDELEHQGVKFLEGEPSLLEFVLGFIRLDSGVLNNKPLQEFLGYAETDWGLRQPTPADSKGLCTDSTVWILTPWWEIAGVDRHIEWTPWLVQREAQTEHRRFLYDLSLWQYQEQQSVRPTGSVPDPCGWYRRVIPTTDEGSS